MLSQAEWWPILILGAGGFVVYIVGRVAARRNGLLAASTCVVYGIALCSLLRLAGRSGGAPAATAALWAEPTGLLIGALALVLGIAVTVYSGRYLALDQRYEYYYPLLLLLSAGKVGMLLAYDLFTLYLFTALTSGSAYVLVAFRRQTQTAIEAGFKYAIMGGMATVLVLAGLGHFYRETGELALQLPGVALGPWGLAGIGMMLFGYAAKAAIVPAHTWLPDAHGRAPSSVSALLSGVVIEVSLYALLKVGLRLGVPMQQLGWGLVVAGLANMTLGNLLALMQVYGKRLLGYSSIAQVGYMLLALGIGLTFGLPSAVAAGLYLLVGHAVMKGLAFLCKGICHYYCGASRLDQLDGMVHRMPVVTVCFAVGLAGLAGIPPLAGFVGKWQLLASLLARPSAGRVIMTVLFAANVLLSLGYYLPIIGRLFRATDGGGRVRVSAWMLAPVLALAMAVVLFGVYPQPLLEVTERAAAELLSWGVPR